MECDDVIGKSHVRRIESSSNRPEREADGGLRPAVKGRQSTPTMSSSSTCDKF